MAPGDHRPLPSNSNSTDHLNLLMTRFRPIAPKPPNNGDPPLRLLPTPDSKPKSTTTKGKCLGVRRRRGRGGDTHCHTSEATSYSLEHHEMEIPGSQTLQLMMIPDPKADESSGSIKASVGEHQHPCSCSSSSSSHSGFLFKSSLAEAEDEGTRPSHPPPLPRPVIPKIPLPDLNNAAFPSFSSDPVAGKRVLDVCLIVESVSKDSNCIQMVEDLLGHTDEERLTGLVAEEDCPCFVSDVDKRVRWVNRAFERMMKAELSSWGEIGVRMTASSEVEEDWNAYSTGEAFFTSRVRIQYTWREERWPLWWGPRVVTVAPCDAWRLCSGGFAWRLDVNSALSLGR